MVEGPKVEGAEKPLNAFETLTLAPIDRRLVETALLDAGELSWLDSYHAQVAKTLSPLVDDETRAWLGAATRPMGQG
jgi:Xaa-Pro aminopeptidase